MCLIGAIKYSRCEALGCVMRHSLTRWIAVSGMKKAVHLTAVTANVVGPQLRRFRLAACLTQKELAAICEQAGLNLTRSMVAKIEARVRFIKACELFIVAKILEVPLESFYPADFGDGLGRAGEMARRQKQRSQGAKTAV